VLSEEDMEKRDSPKAIWPRGVSVDRLRRAADEAEDLARHSRRCRGWLQACNFGKVPP